ncbi:MAG: hypothetical protein ABS43_28120 [Bordetella sp. SCN 67-23]|nr:MAG: hypothetical protein ABS43_28120 [Bordetella sp. SCN 67-23]
MFAEIEEQRLQLVGLRPMLAGGRGLKQKLASSRSLKRGKTPKLTATVFSAVFALAMLIALPYRYSVL